MRHFANWCVLGITISSLAAAAYPPINPSATLPPFYQQPIPTRSIFSRLRDGLIRSIWSIPCNEHTKLSGAKATASGSSAPPSTLLARYGGDVVLRFDIASPEEAVALTEAVNVLFLDVWEFNPEWVDIRLAKDVVRLACNSSRKLRCSDKLIGAVTARSSTAILAARSYAFDA